MGLTFSVIKNGVNQEDLVLINTVRETFFKGSHSWEGNYTFEFCILLCNKLIIQELCEQK